MTYLIIVLELKETGQDYLPPLRPRQVKLNLKMSFIDKRLQNVIKTYFFAAQKEIY